MKREILLIAAIVLIAATFRLWALGDLPPGLYHDEAAEGIDALAIIQDGARPVFLPGNNGREPAYAYFVAAVYSLTGPGAFGLRLASAMLGIISIPMAYVWARRFFGPPSGLLVALLLAISPWHVHLSRLGLRPVILPLLEGLAIYLLWRAYRDRRYCWWALSGITLGITLYTYMPARLLLIITVIPVALTICRKSIDWRHRLAGPALLLAGMLVVAAPLVTYFQQHPDDFLERAQQVSFMNAVRAGADPVKVGQAHLQATLGMFSFQGDSNPRHNLPGRPVFDPFLALATLIGAIVAGSRWRRPEVMALALWLLAGLVPAVVSDSAPHYLRAAGLLPAIMALPALGIAWAWERTRNMQRPWSRIGASGLAIGLLVSGVWSGCDYFILWPTPAAAAFQVDRTLLLNYAATLPAEAKVFYATREPSDPVVTLVSRRPVASFHPDSIPLPLSSAAGVIYLVPETDPELALSLGDIYPNLQPRPVGDGGGLAIQVPTGRGPTLTSNENGPTFGRVLQIVKGTVPMEARSGSELMINLYWRPIAGIDENLVLFTHLRGPDGELWRQASESLGLSVRGTRDWSTDEIVWERRALGIPADAIPGPYQLIVGIESPTSRRRLDVSQDGGATGSQYVLSTVNVTKGEGQPNLALLPIRLRLSQDFGDGLRLLGYNPGVADAQPGGTTTVALFWQALRPSLPGFEIRLRLVDQSGATVASQSNPPANGRYPPSQWRAGEIVRDYQRLQIGASVPPGRYTIVVDVIQGASPVGAPTAVGLINVVDRPRQFVAPSIQHPAQVDLGDSIRLIGYDMQPQFVQPGTTLRVKLYWQSRAVDPTSYTVFIHLLSPGDKVIAQHDSIPQNGRALTTSWLTDEIVTDEHELVLPTGLIPGQYILEAGLYNAANGERLPVTSLAGSSLRVETEFRRILFEDILINAP